MKRGFSSVLGLVTVLAILYGCIVHLGMDFGFGFGRGKSKNIDKTYEYDTDVKNIKIDAALMEVNIEEGNSALVTYSGSEELQPTVDYDKSTKTLTVKQPNNKKADNLKDVDNEMTITLPEGVKLDDFNLELACGDVILEKIAAQEVTIVASLGKVDVQMADTDDIHIIANLGDVDINHCNAKNVDVESSLGSVDIKMEKDIENYAITANASLGSVKVGKRSSGNSFVQTGSEGTILVECSLGDVEIR